MKLPTDLREFIELLNSHDVTYVVVEGYAVAYHGYPRATGDIDFFVELSPANARRLITVLEEFGFASLGLSEKEFLVPGTIIQLGYPPNRIDLVTNISGVTCEDTWERRIVCHVDGVSMSIIDKQTLMYAGAPNPNENGGQRERDCCCWALSSEEAIRDAGYPSEKPGWGRGNGLRKPPLGVARKRIARYFACSSPGSY